jgi:predicted RNA-binding Zn-ribbon protein involved in translation (DUF1610 family)
MDGPSDETPLHGRANELYWHSDTSVNQIADDLDMSKGALYNLVEPLASGLACPQCGHEMEYPNRTAREKGFLSCPACEFEEEEDRVRAEGGSTALVSAPAASGPGDPGRARQLWLATALLGAAVGVAVVLWRRRD